MKRSALHFLTALFALTLVLPAAADVWVLQAFLDGDQEVPPSGSEAFGVASMIYDDATNMFNLTVYVEGISLGVDQGGLPVLIASHIHRAPRGVNGPVIFPLGGPDAWTETPPGISFSIEGAVLPPGDGNINEIALLSNGTYINVHSDVNPTGEIRGQLIVVPEPATMAVLAGGLGALLLRSRRRK